MHRLRERLRSTFLRNVFLLMSGVAAAQVITVAITPVLTRLYEPSAFGVFGVYLSIVSLFAAISTSQYDQALMLPRSLEDSVGLFWLSCLSAAGIAVASAAVCIPGRTYLAALMDSPELADWIWLIPISVFLRGVYTSLTGWSTRMKQFRPAAASQAIQGATTSGSQCVAGIFQASPVGLIAGSLCGSICASVALAVQLARRDVTFIIGFAPLGRLKRLARDYRDFPLYGSSRALLNAVSQSVPFLLLAHFFGMPVAGFYAVGVRVLNLPRRLVLSALRQVLIQRAAEMYRSGGDMRALFVKLTLGLLALCAIPVLILVILSPAVFAFALGEEWRTAGEYARWLVIWLAVAFANVPAVVFSRIYRRQETLLLLETFSLGCRVAALVIGGLYLTALHTVALYSAAGVIYNALLIVWTWDYLRRGATTEAHA